MLIEDFLNRLDGVRSRGTGRYSARCPGHEDKSPSLSIREGERGLLVKCWAGCTLDEITAALGIRVADLFFDAPTPHGQRPTPKPVRIDRVALAFMFELAALDRRLRAERIIAAGKALDVPSLSDAELDRALNAIAQADADKSRAEIFEHVADTLRERDFAERKSRERHTCAA